jgi:hypothetical protein
MGTRGNGPRIEKVSQKTLRVRESMGFQLERHCGDKKERSVPGCDL